jgi:hypothetical protein
MRDDQDQCTLELLSHQPEQRGPVKLLQFPAQARNEPAPTRRPPRRPPNSKVRSREYLTSDEVAAQKTPLKAGLFNRLAKGLPPNQFAFRRRIQPSNPSAEPNSQTVLTS